MESAGGPLTLQVRRRGDHRRMPRKNGGDITHEVASSPAGSGLAGFDSRISFAEAANFCPGVRRNARSTSRRVEVT